MELSTKQLTHIYNKGTPLQRFAIQEVSIDIPSGSFFAVIGQTGSGKSTLIQHLNGLLKPTSGSVHVGNTTLRTDQKGMRLKDIRKHVGMVFQYPEHQLFEETIEKDICFGPKNFGVSDQAAKQRAKKALALVGISDAYLSRSPFELSGGQMRRVAIAGVLAMEPDVLILDEPTAGLDPRGQREIMALFSSLQKEKKMTTILVTHSMEDAAQFAEQITVMESGKVVAQGNPDDIFCRAEELRQIGLDLPESSQLIEKLEKRFNTTLSNAYTVDEAVQVIERVMKAGTSQ